MIKRSAITLIKEGFRSGANAVALLGPRQCGKTTLARQFSKSANVVHFFDLEDPTDLARLNEPKLALSDLRGLIIIDEVQRRPDLFSVLRVLLDRKVKGVKFLILGSASRDLVQQSSETLAGRISYVELQPFSVQEVKDWNKLWLRGGFPNSFLAKTNAASVLWRKDYISTFTERDIPQLGVTIPAVQLNRFWAMLSHYHGQTWNASEIGRSFGVADTTVRRYLDLLTGTFMIRQLQPWYENIGKRVVKAPKIYFRDSGLLHNLLRIQKPDELNLHPKIGSSWEGFAIESIIRSYPDRSGDFYYWAVHGQSEIDLILPQSQNRIGFEIKYTDSPRVTASMNLAMKDLRLKKIYVVYPGDRSFPLSKNIEALSLKEACSLRL